MSRVMIGPKLTQFQDLLNQPIIIRVTMSIEKDNYDDDDDDKAK